jgi:hypothetical protein
MNKLIAQSIVKGCVVRLYGDANTQQTYAYKLWSPRNTVEFRGFDTLKVAKLIDSDDDVTIARVISAYKNGDIKSVAQKATPQYADHYIHDDDSESHNEAIAALQTTLDARQLQSK